MSNKEHTKMYCVPIIVDDRCYTTQSVQAINEEEAGTLALLHWKNAKVDPARPITVVR